MKTDLSALFCPSRVAVIGATEDPRKLGYHVMKSLLIGGFRGTIYPINPGRQEIMGLRAYASLEEIKEQVDMAILVIPAPFVAQQVRLCGRKGVGGIVLITAGFAEIDDPAGAKLQREIAEIASRSRTPIIGPNTFGLVSIKNSLNASFTPEFSLLKKGGISLISQSGGMSHLLAFLAMRDGVGFSNIVGVGNRCNVDFKDLLEWFVNDKDTRCIAMYLEGIDDARGLWVEARRLKGRKPVVGYKCATTQWGDVASRSHTGSLAGNPMIYKGAFSQGGILWVNSSEELLDAAKSLSECPLPKGRKVAILSGQAGPAMAAMDICIKGGLEVVRFSSKTQEKIEALLPPLALRSNPVDMGPAWYSSEAIKGIVETVLGADEIDLVLILVMFASANAGAVESLKGVLLDWKQKKPVITCLSSPPGIWDEAVRDLESKEALVNFPTPERAARAAVTLWQWCRMASGQ